MSGEDGTGRRDYIHVVDLAKGHVKALNYIRNIKPDEDRSKRLSIHNLGTGKSTSVLELLKAFEKVNGVNIPYQIKERRAGDVAESYADPTKSKQELGFETILNIEDMCKDTWRFQKNRKDRKGCR